MMRSEIEYLQEKLLPDDDDDPSLVSSRQSSDEDRIARLEGWDVGESSHNSNQFVPDPAKNLLINHFVEKYMGMLGETAADQDERGEPVLQEVKEMPEEEECDSATARARTGCGFRHANRNRMYYYTIQELLPSREAGRLSSPGHEKCISSKLAAKVLPEDLPPTDDRRESRNCDRRCHGPEGQFRSLREDANRRTLELFADGASASETNAVLSFIEKSHKIVPSAEELPEVTPVVDIDWDDQMAPEASTGDEPQRTGKFSHSLIVLKRCACPPGVTGEEDQDSGEERRSLGVSNIKVLQKNETAYRSGLVRIRGMSR